VEAAVEEVLDLAEVAMGALLEAAGVIGTGQGGPENAQSEACRCRAAFGRLCTGPTGRSRATSLGPRMSPMGRGSTAGPPISKSVSCR
jgi:hypothetical protein